MKTKSVQPSRMTIGIFCYRHPSFMMRQDASMGRFDAISRFPAAVVRTMPSTLAAFVIFCPKNNLRQISISGNEQEKNYIKK